MPFSRNRRNGERFEAVSLGAPRGCSVWRSECSWTVVSRPMMYVLLVLSYLLVRSAGYKDVEETWSLVGCCTRNEIMRHASGLKEQKKMEMDAMVYCTARPSVFHHMF